MDKYAPDSAPKQEVSSLEELARTISREHEIRRRYRERIKSDEPGITDAEIEAQSLEGKRRLDKDKAETDPVFRVRWNAKQKNKEIIENEQRDRAERIKGMTARQKFMYGLDNAITEGPVDHRKSFWAARELQQLDEEAPRLSQMLGVNPTFTRTRDLLGISNQEDRLARKRAGLGLEDDMLVRAGQVTGTIGADLIQDRTRNLYWLLNAPQAIANVIQENALSHFSPELYQSDKVTDDRGREILLDPVNHERLVNDGLIGLTEEGKEILKSGTTRVNSTQHPGKIALSKRKYRPGAVDALGIPTGLAINAGVGLLNPFGGSNGYSAVFESEDDPTKTSNVVGEIAAKYILGRTGNLLPWDEFKKVRPDVSKGEYMRYKAFKYDKGADFDITDGDFTVPTGIIKGTMEGLHGPEIQLLGRSMPLTTTILPTLAAGIGTTMGARWEPSEFKGWREKRNQATKLKDEMTNFEKKINVSQDVKDDQIIEGKRRIAESLDKEFKDMGKAKINRFNRINRVGRGLVGGLGGYALGLGSGLLLENERRRRNQADNEAYYASVDKLDEV
jgi:hypothetical protein